MLAVLSPAKTLDMKPFKAISSTPSMQKRTSELLPFAKKLSVADFKKMGLSDQLATLNVERYKKFEGQPSKQACLAFDGPAFRGLSASDFGKDEQLIAQNRIRVLSGLYGVLRPYDLIQPYRLEMGSKVSTTCGKTLYDFWKSNIAEQLVNDMKATKAAVLVNCASQEYWKSVAPHLPESLHVVTCDFPGPAVYAKKTRGLMCRYIVRNRITDVAGLKGFQGEGEDVYCFNPGKSTSNKLVFLRVSGAKAKPAARKRPAGADESSLKRARA